MSGQAHEREREQKLHIDNRCGRQHYQIVLPCFAGRRALHGGVQKLDARWINRISGEVTLDFIKALAPKVYYDNIGVIRWGKTPGKNEMAWQFRGKINFLPVYADDLEEWQDKTNNTQSYPVERRNRAEWTLPVWIFGKDFFQSKVNGKMETICDENQPCLFKIQSF